MEKVKRHIPKVSSVFLDHGLSSEASETVCVAVFSVPEACVSDRNALRKAPNDASPRVRFP